MYWCPSLYCSAVLPEVCDLGSFPKWEFVCYIGQKPVLAPLSSGSSSTCFWGLSLGSLACHSLIKSFSSIQTWCCIDIITYLLKLTLFLEDLVSLIAWNNLHSIWKITIEAKWQNIGLLIIFCLLWVLFKLKKLSNSKQ